MLTNAYADQVASHGEVAVFRAKKQVAINRKKVQLRTQLEVVGALGVLDDELTGRQLDPVTFSRLVLGMMIGNGYRDGVTPNLKASSTDRVTIERVVKLAASHMNGPNFEQNQIWAPQGNPPMQMQHLGILNNWMTEAAKAAPPYFNHEPRAAKAYQPLDQIIVAICQSFNDSPSQAMIQQAQQLSQNLGPDFSWPIKQFIVCFSMLTAEEQAEIVRVYNAYVIDWEDEALQLLATECATPHHARELIQQRIEERTIGPIRGLIDAIPDHPIRNLSPTGSTLQQRERIRDFLAILNPPAAPDPRAPVVAAEPLTLDQKEMCLNELFSRKLNRLIPAAAIVDQVKLRKIVLNPAITGTAVIGRVLNLNLNAQIKEFIQPINRLPDVARDIHYKALIERIRQMRPAINPKPGGDTEEELQEAFNVAQNRLINTLIRNRIEAITPPRELISPAPRMPEVNGMVDGEDHGALVAYDYTENLQLTVGVAQDPNNANFNQRLIRFFLTHWGSYYSINGDANMGVLRDALQARLTATDNLPGTIIGKKQRKIQLIENIAYQLLSHSIAQPQALVDYQNAIAARNAQVQALLGVRLDEMGMRLGQDADIEQQLRPIIEQQIPQLPAHAVPQVLDYTDIGRVATLINAATPQTHVYTSMAAIRALPFINWNDVLDNHVFNAHPELRPQQAELVGGQPGPAYWHRIGNYVMEIYTNKIKPHIFPNGLLGLLNQNNPPPLVPFVSMFSDGEDATNAINYSVAVHGPGVQERVFAFDISPATLQNLPFGTPVGIKQKLHDSYEKTHNYVVDSIEKLFGLASTVVFRDNATNWVFYSAIINQMGLDAFGNAAVHSSRSNIDQNFTAERQELCKKMLLILSYFNRDGDHYHEDVVSIGALVGRFTHCADGKKGAIAAVSQKVLHELVGNDAAADAEADTLDACLKQKILEEFKSEKITLVADHNHAENVSITTDAKFRNQAFWNVPTQAQAQFVLHYKESSDYATLPRDEENTDRILQHFFQHIYVGPHELVNTIHRYLLSLDAHGRVGFIGLVCAMLAHLRPFSDMELELIPTDDLVKQRYCEIIPPVAGADPHAEPDYIFTRKGIETILFYAGYLAWGGPEDQHPLIADWNANLRWLYNIDREEEEAEPMPEENRHERYRAIYDAPPL